MSKMSISTPTPNKSENMEIIGLDRDFAKEFFQIPMLLVSLKLSSERLERFHFKNSLSAPLKDIGLVHWRKNGEARYTTTILHHLRRLLFKG